MNGRLLICVCIVLPTLIVTPSFAYPTPACRSESGISLCVQFDNLPDPPEEFTDFEVTFNGNVPSVDLKTGRNPQGTLYKWRVWCKDASGAPANIGEIKGIANYDYDVTILDENGGRGVATLGAIRLDPEGDDKFSNLSGGNIGTLTGKLTLQQAHGAGSRDRH